MPNLKRKILATCILANIGFYANAAGFQARVPLDALRETKNEVADLPTIGAFNLSPSAINEGDNVTASWQVSGAKYYILTGNGADSNETAATSTTFSPTGTGNFNYKLEAFNFQHASSEATASLEIVPKPVISSFSSDKSTVFEGQDVVFSWSGEKVFAYKINNNTVTGNTQQLTQNTVGNIKYTLDAYNKLGYKVSMEKQITVIADPVPSELNLNVSPSTITLGESTTASWTGKNVVKYSLEGEAVSNPNVTGSSLSITPNSIGDKTYKLTAYNNKGQTIDTSKSVKVLNPPSISSFTVDKNSITNGDSVTFNWSLKDSSKASLNGVDVSGVNSATYTPNTTTNYKLTGFNSNNYPTEQSLTVTVISKSEIASFTASKMDVSPNEEISLNWAVNNASAITLNGTTVTGNTTKVAPKTTSTYTLLAQNSLGNKVSKDLTVNVVENPAISSFTVNGGSSATVDINSNLNFAWNSTGNAVTINTTPVTGKAATLTASGSAGTTTYTLTTQNSIGIKTTANVNVTTQNWIATSSTYSSWTNSSGVYNCSNWSPDPSTVNAGQTYTQTATNCYVNQTRTRQDRQYETGSGQYRNIGAAVTESQIVGGQSSTRTATGTRENWVATSSVYSGWWNTSGTYNCNNWGPDPSNYDSGTQFTQSANDCLINQARTRQDRQYETYTGQYRNVGGQVTETQTIGGQYATRTATGTRPTVVCEGGGWVAARDPGIPPYLISIRFGGATIYSARIANNSGDILGYDRDGYRYTKNPAQGGLGQFTVCRARL